MCTNVSSLDVYEAAIAFLVLADTIARRVTASHDGVNLSGAGSGAGSGAEGDLVTNLR